MKKSNIISVLIATSIFVIVAYFLGFRQGQNLYTEQVKEQFENLQEKQKRELERKDEELSKIKTQLQDCIEEKQKETE